MTGSREYINVVSAYRSPATNEMLRRTRGGQAEKSQHMVGKALDFYIPGVKLATLRESKPLEELAAMIREYGRRNISVASELLPGGRQREQSA